MPYIEEPKPSETGFAELEFNPSVITLAIPVEFVVVSRTDRRVPGTPVPIPNLPAESIVPANALFV